MRQAVLTCGPYAAGSVNYYVTSATPVSGTALTLAHTTAPDAPLARRILLTYGNEASARTLVLTGTSQNGDIITETLAVPSGGSGTVVSVLDYLTLTSALPLGSGWTAAATLGTVTSGTNTPVASSPLWRADDWGFPEITLQAVVTGTVTYTVETSLDDPNVVLPMISVAPASMTWQPTTLAGNSTNAQEVILGKPLWIRLTINSATATSGSATLTIVQAGGKLG